MTKIVMRGFPNNGSRIVSAREAVENSFRDSLDDQGAVLALLIQLLIDKGVLTLEDIAPMLGCRYTVEE